MKINNDKNWQIWIDTGGTFTDCLALDPQGKLHRAKVLSSSSLRGIIDEVITPQEFRVKIKWKAPANFIKGFQFRLMDRDHPEVIAIKYDPAYSVIELDRPLRQNIAAGVAFELLSPEEPPLLASRLITGTTIDSELPRISMRLATTRGTNALLERRGVPVALFITEGFADLLRIGNQQRPDLFALNIQKPEPLYQEVVGVPERISADGEILHPLKLEEMGDKIAALLEKGIQVAAVALMHSFVNPDHELQLADYLLKSGFKHVSVSSNLAPFIKILPRAETAVVDAYLSPIIDNYLAKVQSSLIKGRLHVMTSAGGVVRTQSFHAKDSLLSGPAGGVVGAVVAARRSGFEKIIAFDMGGTSTDVARFDGDYDYIFEHTVGDAHLVAPALAIESVAAGGGSICNFKGMELSIGPESAGAQPGPACYGASGPLTLTDVNLLLGRLDATRFEIPINIDAANQELDKIIQQIERTKNEDVNKEQLLEGFLDIANERMADAIRRISIRKGYDPKEYTLIAFGGAGGQHACAVAEQLKIETILIPQDASLLSAMGLGHALIERFAERQILQPLDDVLTDVPQWIHELAAEAATNLEQEGVQKNDIVIRRKIINLRFAGQDSVLPIEYDDKISLENAFEEKYQTIFGYYQQDRPIELESIRVVVSSQANHASQNREKFAPFNAQPNGYITAYYNGKWRSVPTFERHCLTPGAKIKGMALIFEQHSTTVVEDGWTAEIDGVNALILKKTGDSARINKDIHPEIVRLELFTNRFQTIAREMGEMLRRTAISTNVKERLDFSCAILDKECELVVNAPHIPVHLGAMGLCVRALKKTLSMEPGDVIVTNSPEFGGSHLPDVTVVTPVYLPNGTLLGYVTNRAHHAEIGGEQPGSMPPMATSLAEEGVVIPPTYLFKKGEAQWEEIQRILVEAPFPSRSIEENLADLRAAVAANRSGESALLKLAEQYGEKTICHYMKALKQRAETKIRMVLDKIPDGRYEALERLDDGTPLRVVIEISGDQAVIDFSGCGEMHPNNLNATPAIVNSVVVYVLRLLVNEPLPLNEGLLSAVTMHIPPGILNPEFPDDPYKAPAVVGGNVETSQRLVDTLLKATGLAACSQGTMNNIVFGTDRYSYYETVCGGCGAGPDFDGASAVHSHMTNTRITDPEIIEHRYPVRVDKFVIRARSGGEGKHRGGDGVIRQFTFLDNMYLSVLGQHRKEHPFGLEGGKPGESAKQYVVRKAGEKIELDSIDGCEVFPGDRFILETPGGGGYGLKSNNEGALDSKLQ